MSLNIYRLKINWIILKRSVGISVSKHRGEYLKENKKEFSFNLNIYYSSKRCFFFYYMNILNKIDLIENLQKIFKT